MTYIQFPRYPRTPTSIITHVVSQKPLPTPQLPKFKKAGKKTSHVVVILDNSISMRSTKSATISGYNEFIAAQKEDAAKTGIDTFISLYKFGGNSVESVFERKPIDTIEDLTDKTYNPNKSSTNLNDAIGSTIIQVNQQLSRLKKKHRDSIIIATLTDGAENSSRNYTADSIKTMVSAAEEKNWGFLFLGANIDAFAVGHAYGFNANNTMQYNVANMENTMRSASAMTSRMKSAYASGDDTQKVYATTAFTDDERKASID